MCFPDFCFSNRKGCDLYSPENLSRDHRKYRGKCENSGFFLALQMDQFNLKSAPKRKSRPEVRSAENFQNGRPFWGFPEFFSSPQNDEIFESLKMGYFIISKNSLRDSQKFAQPQNRVCISQKRSQKDSNLQPLSAG